MNRISFDESGALIVPADATLGEVTQALVDRAHRFHARIMSCPRDAEGNALLVDPHAGPLHAIRQLWAEVVSLASCANLRAAALGGPVDQLATGPGVSVLGPTLVPGLRPFSEALRQLIFAIPHRADGQWVDRVPPAALAKIQSITSEIELYLRQWDRRAAELAASATTSSGAARSKRRPKRSPADVDTDDRKIAAFLIEHPDATRDEIARGTGVSGAHVSASRVFAAVQAQRKSRRAANRAGRVADPDRFGDD